MKLVTQHVWERYIEKAEDIRHTLGNKEIYQKRKETIERIFGTAKEHHGFRYTQYIGKARIEMKAGITFACMNLKKLAKILVMRNRKSLSFIYRIEFLLNKINAREKWCLTVRPGTTLSTVCAAAHIEAAAFGKQGQKLCKREARRDIFF